MTLSSSQIDEIVDQICPGGRSFRADPARGQGWGRIIDNRGKWFTHGYTDRIAFSAGEGPLAVIGGIYGTHDSRQRTEGWEPAHKARGGEDCLEITANSPGEHFLVSGCAFDSTWDAVAPSKGLEANRSESRYLIEHCYFRVIRDECHENDGCLRGKVVDTLADSTYMFISMRNPNADSGYPNVGFTELERCYVRFACQPDPRPNNSGCGSGFGSGGKIFKAGGKTGNATYKQCFFLFECRSNNHTEDQGFRNGPYTGGVYFLYAPKGNPQPFFRSLPSGCTDLGVHNNGYDAWLAVRDRWLSQHDCRPKDNYFGFTTGQTGGSHPPAPNIAAIRDNWAYNYGPRAGSDPGEPPPPGKPATPGNARTTTVEKNRVVLAWNAVTVTGATIVYRVRRGGTTLADNLTVTSYEDATVQPNTGYTYEILAVNTTANMTSDAASVFAQTPEDGVPVGEFPVRPLPVTFDTNNRKARILRTLTKPANATGVQFSLTGFDFDAPDEGRVFINTPAAAGSQPAATVSLFGAQAAGDNRVTTLTFPVPVDAFRNGENTFDFEWLRTVGFRIDQIAVTFQTGGDPIEPPATPTLVVGVVEARKVNLSWNNVATAGRTITYTLRRNGVVRATLATLSFLDETVEPETTYSYTIQAIDTPNNLTSAQSPAVQVTTPSAGVANQAPSVPTGLTATSFGSDFVQLQWNASTDVDGTVARYQIRRNGTLVQEPTVTNYRDQGLLPDTQYSYTVAAVDNLGLASGQSGALSVRTQVGEVPEDPLPPTVPQNLRTTLVEAHRVTIAWNASTDPDGTIRSYVVRRNGSVIDETVNTFFTDTSVVANTVYFYTLQAVDDDQQVSGISSPLTVTVPPAPEGMTQAQLEERLTKLELVLEELAEIFAQIEEKLRRVQELPDEVC